MHPLYQRLRELDWDTFQRLVGQLLSARFPNLNIRAVDGPGGDGGLDVFTGSLDGRPTIWQCKQFPKGLGPKQREKVKASLKSAIDNYDPRNWILVLPIDLDDKQHAWFEKLKRAYASKVTLGLFQGSDIVRELIYRRALRDAFFPGAVLDSVTLRRATQGMAGFDRADLEGQTDDKVAEIVARLEEVDARFNYRLVYAPNAGPESLTDQSASPLQVASLVRDGHRIDVLARDLDALRIDPPSFQLRVKASGAEKIQRSFETGDRVTLDPSEVVSFSSTFDFLLPAGKAQGMQVTLSTSGPLQHRRPKLNLRFESPNEQVEYPYVEFQILRAGSEESEIESISPHLGFTLNLTLPMVPGKEAQFGLTRKFAGSEVKVVEKALRVLLALSEGATITLHDVEHDLPLGRIEAKTDITDDWRSYRQLVADAIVVAERFGLSLRVPERIGTADVAAIDFYKSLIGGNPLPIETFSATLIKRLDPEILETVQKAEFLEAFVALPNLPTKLPVFGATVDTGPITLLASKAKIHDEPAFWKRFLKAQEGDAVPVTIEAESVRAFLGPTAHQGLFIRPDPSQEIPDSK